MKTMTKKCQRCRTAPWRCRSCDAKLCEHFCSLKTDDGYASCGACKAASLRFVLGEKHLICHQFVCPGSLGGDHDGRCPLFDPEVT